MHAYHILYALYKYTHAHLYTYIYIYIHMYMYIYIYTHVSTYYTHVGETGGMRITC